MCYSAMIQADYDKFCRQVGAIMSLEDFAANVWDGPNRDRKRKQRRKMPRAVENWFLGPQSDPLAADIGQAILEARQADMEVWRADLVKQRERLAANEAKMATKPTATAAKEVRIAGNQITKLEGWLEDAQSTQLSPKDYRFYPHYWWVPVMVMEHGRLVVKPMRYQLRKAGKKPEDDYIRGSPSGTYCNRRDQLTLAWRKQFGRTHGVVLIDSFLENVKRHDMEHRELQPGEEPENVVLEFSSASRKPLLIACLWDHWEGPGEAPFDSFGFITDEPPPEIAAAGHDRVPIWLEQANLLEWLTPEGRSDQQLQSLLDQRPETVFDHQVLAEARAA